MDWRMDWIMDCTMNWTSGLYYRLKYGLDSQRLFDSWSYDRVMLQLLGAAGTGESQGQDCEQGEAACVNIVSFLF